MQKSKWSLESVNTLGIKLELYRVHDKLLAKLMAEALAPCVRFV